MADKYLFVCGYGESRSPAFAERMAAIKHTPAIFAGMSDDATVSLCQGHIDWATHIVFLERPNWLDVTQFRNWADKNIIEFVIDDIPAQFVVEFERFQDEKL